jgi:23S rRNA (uracil1939-C5)-methyltransferase
VPADTRGAERSAVMAEPVRIGGIAAGGDGVGRLADGRAIFVPRSAPGDLIRLAGLELKSRFGRGRVGQLLEPGPDRVTPRCAHYDRDACGGCQLQHLSPTAQRAARRTIVGDALRRIARLDISDPELEPAVKDWGYRTKLTLAVQARGRLVGLHRHDRPADIFNLTRCEIADPALNRLWTALSPLRELLPPDASHVILRLERGGALHVIVRSAGERAWTSGGELRSGLRAAGVDATVWWHPEGGAPRVVAGDGTPWPATVFEQVHPALGDRVRAYALEQLGDVRGRKVWDLYAGIGETTTRLLEAGANVESVELDPRAVALAGPEVADGVRRHRGLAEEVVSRLKPADLVITNPPRTGMDPRVIDAILATAPRRVVYISCDPATLARDLGRMCGGDSRPPALPPVTVRESFRVRLSATRAFDLFPQTAHIETVAVLEAA